MPCPLPCQSKNGKFPGRCSLQVEPLTAGATVLAAVPPEALKSRPPRPRDQRGWEPRHSPSHHHITADHHRQTPRRVSPHSSGSATRRPHHHRCRRCRRRRGGHKESDSRISRPPRRVVSTSRSPVADRVQLKPPHHPTHHRAPQPALTGDSPHGALVLFASAPLCSATPVHCIALHRRIHKYPSCRKPAHRNGPATLVMAPPTAPRPPRRRRALIAGPRTSPASSRQSCSRTQEQGKLAIAARCVHRPAHTH